jgi:hypothetical protein
MEKKHPPGTIGILEDEYPPQSPGRSRATPDPSPVEFIHSLPLLLFERQKILPFPGQ